MKRELLLMRHGKAARMPGVRDRERPLRERGKRAAQRLGVWLWQQDLRPGLAIASPAERALVSAEKCCKAMDLGLGVVREDERLFPGDVSAIREVLAERGDDVARILLVGHKPACDDFLREMVGENDALSASGRLLRTGTLAHLEIESGWDRLEPGSARLCQMVQGRRLPKKFPYPAPHGSEGRDRPAYYYQQSGVIPFRQRKGQLEVLVVRSSQHNHWVVPKGVSGPGQTLQESAREEAFEEAGVEGEVLDIDLGTYTIEKWGATCSVTMFPLRVAHMLDEDEWQEDHRGREWLPLEDAAQRVQQKELTDMIRALPGKLGGD